MALRAAVLVALELLYPGKPVEKELAGGQSHEYGIELAAGQYVHVVVEQRGIDVVVRLLDPAGKKIAEVDSPNGAQGPEPVSAITEAAGAHRLVVAALEKDAKPGHYEARIAEVRAATEKDRNVLRGEALVAEARALRDKGTGQALAEAAGRYEAAANRFQAAGNLQRQAFCLHETGWAYENLGDLRKAVGFYERALAIRRRLDEPGGLAVTLNNLGTATSALGEKRKALEFLGETLQLGRSTGNRRTEAMALNSIGAIHGNLGEYREAVDFFNQALKIFRAIGQKAGEASTLNNIGALHSDQDDHLKALEYFGAAHQLASEAGEAGLVATTLNNMGNIYASAGDIRTGVQYVEQALAAQRKSGDHMAQARTLSNLGGQYADLGEQEKGLEYLEQALQLAKSLGNPGGQAGALHNMASIYSEVGDDQAAARYYEQALPLRRASGDRRSEASTLDNIGLALTRIGEYPRALEYYTQALSLARALPAPRVEAATLNNIGFLHARQGEKSKAKGYFEQALVVRRRAGDRRGEAVTLSNLGRIAFDLGERQGAFDRWGETLKIVQALGDRMGEEKVLFNLALAERAGGNLEVARTRMEASLAIAESVRSGLDRPELRVSLLASVQDRYGAYVDLLMEMRQEEKAFEAAERSRARGLLELLGEAWADIRQGVDPQLLLKERSLGLRVDRRAARLVELLAGGKAAPEQVAALRKEIDELEAEYRQAQAAIRRNSPRYAALTQPQPLSLKEIQTEVLDTGTVLLEYALGEKRSLLWAVTRESLRSFELPKREEVEKAARRVHDLLTARNRQVKGESEAQRRQRIAQADAEYPKAAAALSEMILKPAGPLPKGKRLLVVADGALRYIPFEALPEPGGRAPLVVGREVVSVPSASVLAVLRRETEGRKAAPKMLAVLADPVFDARDPRVSGAPAAAGANRVLERAALDTGAMSDELRLPRLVYTRREAEGIAKLTPGGLKAVDFQANLETATGAGLSQYRMVHFATHGLLNAGHPSLSGLVLSLVDEKGKPRDGFLKLADVYNLNLPAELVVLSACQTGLGKEIRGEGLVGLVRGFMYAGAKRVVASLWKVDDAATAELMQRFYRGMVEGKERPAAALRRAQVEMQKQRRWASPYYWAAFGLQGEWR